MFGIAPSPRRAEDARDAVRERQDAPGVEVVLEELLHELLGVQAIELRDAPGSRAPRLNTKLVEGQSSRFFRYDGVCGPYPYENYCNCPQDCSEPDG